MTIKKVTPIVRRMGTKIEWTDETINPVRGCRRKSTGCENCYAERLAATRLRHLDKYSGLASMTENGPRWSGMVQEDIEEMKKVLKWRKPKRIFVCDMSDLFYENVSDGFIEDVFAVMAMAPQHQFQILTKRSRRMAEWFLGERPFYGGREGNVIRKAEAMGLDLKLWPGWPLPNVWVGVSTENQSTADERIPDLLNTPAAIRYISYEPALGPVELRPWWLTMHLVGNDGKMHVAQEPGIESIGGRWRHPLDWVIAGAESGPGRRPCEIEWIRGAKDRCEEAGVAFFFKQMMENGRKVSLPVLDGKTWSQYPAEQDQHEHK